MLKKINWKFRKTHITVSPLTIFINNTWEGWGFDILNIQKGLYTYSLLKMVWILPNGAERKLKFSGDFLFLRNPLLKQLDDVDDRLLWGNATKWDELKFWALKLIFNQ